MANRPFAFLPSGPMIPWLNRAGFRLIALAPLALMLGCLHGARHPVSLRSGESLVLIGEEPATLADIPLRRPAPVVRSSYLPGTNTFTYAEGRDYQIDYTLGTLSRMPGSQLPDFRTNRLFGKEEFDHNQFPGFGNKGFFAFVDYATGATNPWPVQAPQIALLPKTHAKLNSGGTVRLVAFGDSITAGGDASAPSLIYWERWADELRRRHPAATITAVNGSTGGDRTVEGLSRLQARVLETHPDLVLVAFGMNDHNKGGTPLPQFETNLKEMITRIRSTTSAEVILLSAFPPNPKWKFGSHHMEDYALATERVARETACAHADVFRNWQALVQRKKPEDLLGNNINHPNDYGHSIYFQVLGALGL